MNYCKYCKYKTDDKSNFKKHCTTRRHKKNKAVCKHLENSTFIHASYKAHMNHSEAPQERLHTCTYCQHAFKTASNLGRHVKTCIYRINEENKIKRECELLTERVKESEKREKLYREQIEQLQKIICEAGGTIKTSPAGLILKHCKNAPPMKKIDTDSLNYKEMPKDRLTSELISAFKHKTLHEYLGKVIISIYKKDDVTIQSIFNTDSARLTYMIKELLIDNTSEWIIDKKGVKASNYMIDPLIDHIKELMHDFEIKPFNKDIMTTDEMIRVLKDKREIINLLNEIDDGRLRDKVIKFISPYFQIEKKKIKKLVNNDPFPMLD